MQIFLRYIWLVFLSASLTWFFISLFWDYCNFYHKDVVLDFLSLSTQLSCYIIGGLVSLVGCSVHVPDSIDLIIDSLVDIEKALFWWHSLIEDLLYLANLLFSFKPLIQFVQRDLYSNLIPNCLSIHGPAIDWCITRI